MFFGYRPFIISAIVDDKVVCALNSYWLQACINFRAKRVAMLTFQNPLPLRLFKLSILLSIQPYKKGNSISTKYQNLALHPHTAILPTRQR